GSGADTERVEQGVAVGPLEQHRFGCRADGIRVDRHSGFLSVGFTGSDSLGRLGFCSLCLPFHHSTILDPTLANASHRRPRQGRLSPCATALAPSSGRLLPHLPPSSPSAPAREHRTFAASP